MRACRERFERKVLKDPITKCWNWGASINNFIN